MAFDAHRDINILRKYSPDQPRVPAGNSDGGQWTSGDGEGEEAEGFQHHPVDEAAKTLDLDAAIDHLISHAQSQSQGWCAKYVRSAISAGGVSIASPPVRLGSIVPEARDYGVSLEKAGFKAVLKDTQPATPPLAALLKRGDVAVIQSTTTSRAGHMAMYTGRQWISDYRQRGFWPGAQYRAERPSYTIYRARRIK